MNLGRVAHWVKTLQFNCKLASSSPIGRSTRHRQPTLLQGSRWHLLVRNKTKQNKTKTQLLIKNVRIFLKKLFIYDAILFDQRTFFSIISCFPSKTWVYHSHSKRNSLDTRAAFIEFLEYVSNSGVVVYWGDRPLSRSSRLAMAFKEFWHF